VKVILREGKGADTKTTKKGTSRQTILLADSPACMVLDVAKAWGGRLKAPERYLLWRWGTKSVKPLVR